ncbi:hypothetical protein E4U54_005084 [Claviceps lovelessii]|nr:hypothetical protein E4U54_005084 [Claviceps lovelessii]
MSDPSKSRIAIKLGGPSTSTPTSRPSPRGAVPRSSLGKRARQTPSATAVLGDESDSDSDSDSDSERHHHRRRQHQAITAFGQDGAETDRTDNPPKKQYVIAKQPNRDWRSEMKAQRRSRNPLPEEAQPKQPPHPPDQDENLQWGLILPPDKKAEARRDDDTQSDSQAQNQNQNQTQAPDSLPQPAACRPETRPRTTTTTDDDEALAALLGNNKPRGPEKRIPAPSEDEVYKRDAAGAGAASTLEDYEAMPVEEFGAALLRGMGWNGDPTGPKVKEVRRRPNRLGLGAKELKDAEDLGGWNQTGQKAKPKTRPRLADYRREESRRKEERGREDSYKRERERERERERDREWHRDRRTDSDGDRDRHSRYKEERRHRDRNRDGYRDSHPDRRR